MNQQNKKLILAVDLDNTLIYSEKKTYKITGINIELLNRLKILQMNGHKLIAWTVRDKTLLSDAIEYIKGYGLIFDKINNNVIYLSNSKKIYADYYIDDRAITPEEFLKRVKENKL